MSLENYGEAPLRENAAKRPKARPHGLGLPHIGLPHMGRFFSRLGGASRAADRDLRYRTLFECVSDGFAVVEVIRDGQGHVCDYLVLEANPALLKILRMDASPVGKRQSEILPSAPQAWLQACEAALAGEPLSFEYHRQDSERWFEIHLSRMGVDRLAQLVVEVTDRKRTEARHRETFDELNHRVKNNLAIVSAMLEMQARATTAPQVREPLLRAVDRVKTIADVHASLYRTGQKDEVDFASYLQDLCARLRTSVVDSERIDLTLETEPAALPLDTAVALGVVVNELITNAVKHAFPPPAIGEVSVRLTSSAAGLSVTVGDSGPGLPAEPPRSGLGMRLVRSLVQQMGAALQIEHHPGVTFHIRLPGRRGAPAAPEQAPLL